MLDTGATYFGSSIDQYLLFFGIVIAGAIVAKLVLTYFKHHLKRTAKKTDTRFDDVIVAVLGHPFAIFVIAVSAAVGRIVLTPIDEVARVLDGSITILVIVGTTWMAIRFSDELINEYLNEFTDRTETQLDDQLVPVLRRAVRISFIAIAILVLLDSFGYNITAIMASFGIGGIAVAFAAREMLADVFGGFTIFTGRPFVVGDEVQIGDITGEVEEVGLRFTRIRDYDGRLVTLPNAKVAGSNIVNISEEPARRIVMYLGLTYETSRSKIEEAEEQIIETINSVEGIDTAETDAWLWEYGDSAIQLRVHYYIDDRDDWFDVKDAVNRELRSAFEDHEIEIAYPTQRVILDEKTE